MTDAPNSNSGNDDERTALAAAAKEEASRGIQFDEMASDLFPTRDQLGERATLMDDSDEGGGAASLPSTYAPVARKREEQSGQDSSSSRRRGHEFVPLGSTDSEVGWRDGRGGDEDGGDVELSERATLMNEGGEGGGVASLPPHHELETDTRARKKGKRSGRASRSSRRRRHETLPLNSPDKQGVDEDVRDGRPFHESSLMTPDEAKVEVAAVCKKESWGDRCRRIPCKPVLWISTIMFVGLLTTFFMEARKNPYTGKPNIMTLDANSLHDYNDRGSIRLTSSAFENGQDIPEKYTVDGSNISPPLAWSSIPPGAVSLVLIMDDHVSNSGNEHQKDWSHWVAYNVPVKLDGLPENVAKEARHNMKWKGSTAGSETVTFSQGINSWGGDSHGYRGPDQGRRSGLHYYVFTLFALDGTLGLDPNKSGRAAVMRAMYGQTVLGYGKLIGTYERFHN